jgi:hypothetical protein
VTNCSSGISTTSLPIVLIVWTNIFLRIFCCCEESSNKVLLVIGEGGLRKLARSHKRSKVLQWRSFVR